MAWEPHGAHLIAGDWVATADTFPSEPASGPVHRFSIGTPDLVAQACAAKGLLPLGFVGSIGDFSDLAAFRLKIEQARQLGFRGAAVIHPAQVAILNQGFGPSADELSWAARVVQAAAAAGEGAFQLDGRMIDRPIVMRAHRWLRQAGQGARA